eukprot:5902-Rhodomonas_salina.2
MQADMRTARQYEGTGLGLSLVKQMVGAHNGRVSIQTATKGPQVRKARLVRRRVAWFAVC